jgi:acyl-CoA synthetase (AMP-forming)/AMP-acid ligase II
MTHVCSPLVSSAQHHAMRTAIICEGRTSNARQLHNAVAFLSSGLTTFLQVRPGDRVALLGENTDAFLVSLLAVMDAGAIACPLNWRWSALELRAALDLTQPVLLLADQACLQLAEAATADCHVPISLMQLGHPAAAAAAAAPPPIPLQPGSSTQSLQFLLDLAAAAHHRQQQQQQQCNTTNDSIHPQLQLLQSGQQDICLICFTSGTTGASKGAALSHQTLMHQVGWSVRLSSPCHTLTMGHTMMSLCEN